MSFSDKQIELLQNLYNDASLGLTTGKKLLSDFYEMSFKILEAKL